MRLCKSALARYKQHSRNIRSAWTRWTVSLIRSCCACQSHQRDSQDLRRTISGFGEAARIEKIKLGGLMTTTTEKETEFSKEQALARYIELSEKQHAWQNTKKKRPLFLPWFAAISRFCTWDPATVGGILKRDYTPDFLSSESPPQEAGLQLASFFMPAQLLGLSETNDELFALCSQE